MIKSRATQIKNQYVERRDISTAEPPQTTTNPAFSIFSIKLQEVNDTKQEDN